MTKYLLMASTALILPVTAAAQEVEDSLEVFELETIVVTAQRRKETIQDVPLAVAAIAGDDIAARGKVDVRDLAALTPGATFTFINAAEPVLSIRGISSGGEGAASDSGVLMMADGEVISRDFMRSAPIFDVERVEVLRGPHGTTYGRNATGGVFHIIHKRPSDEFEAEIAAEFGNYSNIQVNGSVNGALSDTTNARAAIYYHTHNGFSEDSVTGEGVDDRETLAGRVALEHRFSEDVSTLVRAHYSRERHGQTGPLKPADPLSPFITPPFAPAVYIEGIEDPYVVAIPEGSYFDRDIWGISNELTWNMGEMTLTSLTAFSHGDNEFVQATPAYYNHIEGLNKADVFSQELRIDGNLMDDRLYFVGGLYYLNEDVEFGFTRNGYPGSLVTQWLSQTSSGKSYGVFAEAAWQITEPLQFTFGARYSRDEKDFYVDNRAEGAFAFIFVEDPSQPLQVSASDSWEKPTFRASLNYSFSENISAYFTYSQGYKSGGFNPEPINAEIAATSFDEETVDNFELGIRSQLFDNRLRLNLTGFDMSYKDIQTGFFGPGGGEVIGNIGEASIKGLEAEFIARPSEYVTLSGALAVFEHEYVEFEEGGVDVSGGPIAKAPDWTLNLSAKLSTPVIADSGRLNLKVDYHTRSDVNHDAVIDPIYGIRSAIDNLNAHLTWEPEEGSWEASLWVRNLLDEAEVQYVGPQVILAQRPVIYGPPMTFGASLKVRFN